MGKSLATVIEEAKQRYGTKDQTFQDFPIGTPVQVITPCEDFTFFRGTETGKVIRNSGNFLGIIVEFDEPMVYESGYVRKEHNFSPSDLIQIPRRLSVHASALHGARS